MSEPTRSSQRDPFIDAVRALAVLLLVTGHWLATAMVAGSNGFLVENPLRYLPAFTPLSWVLQTLGLFFLAGGFGAAVSWARSTTGVASWWFARFRRLAVAVLLVIVGWAVVLVVMSTVGTTNSTQTTVINLVTSPLWFLAVYLVLLALTPVSVRLNRRFGLLSVLGMTVAAALVDIAVAVGAPAQLGQVNVLLVWWAAWQFGVWLAGGRRVPAGAAVAMLASGAAVYALLVTVAGYPASAVGGTGDVRSNLAPPSMAALALVAAQCGVVLLLRPWLRSNALLRWVNANALAIFLLHQTAMVAVTLLLGTVAVLPGLHTVPDSAGWVVARLAWLPLLAAVLVVLVVVMRRVLGGRRPAREVA